MTVLLTGAHGTVGTAVTATSAAYDHVLLDREPAPDELGDGSPHPTPRSRDCRRRRGRRRRSRAPLTDAMTEHEVAAIVHLAGDPTLSATYASVERNNVRGTRNVLRGRVACRGRNRRLRLLEPRRRDVRDGARAPALYPDDEARPSTTEARSVPTPTTARRRRPARRGAGCTPERGIDCYALRIGSVRGPAFDHPFGDAERAVAAGERERDDDDYETAVARMRCTWLSRRDCAALVDACLDDGTDDDNVWTEPRHRRWRRIRSVLRGQRQPERVVRPHPRSRAGGYEPADSGNAMTEPPR